MDSTTTNRRGVAAFDFATVSGYDLLGVGPANARDGTLDLMSDVHDQVRVAVAALIGNSDHYSLSAVISMAHVRGYKLVYCQERFPESSSELEYSLWCNTRSALA